VSYTSTVLDLLEYPTEIQAAPYSLSYNHDQLVSLYEAMRLARTFEERLAVLYRQGRTHGAVYLGIGQEAISVGCASLLEENDLFSTVSRNLSAWFYRGVKPEHVMARWLGKDQAPSHGRDLGLFLADLETYGLTPFHNGSMASWVPSGAGYALAIKMRRQPNICMAFTGDGATSPGDFYEGLNFASIHKLPLVIIAEMNQFAYSTPPEKQMPVINIADRAPAFNIYSETAYGNDLFTVIDAARRGIDHARHGGGPALIEFRTFRQRGHGEHDDCSYVPQHVREFWEQRDPLLMYRNWLTGCANITEAELSCLDDEIESRIEAAVEYAEELGNPAPETVKDRLFAPSVHDPNSEDWPQVFDPIVEPAIPKLLAQDFNPSRGNHF